MSTVTEVRVFRGVALLSFDDAPPLKVRLKHFKALPLQAGDDIDVEEYAAQVAEAQRADAYEAALNSLDLCARTREEGPVSAAGARLCFRGGGSDARPPRRQRPCG